MKKIALGLTAFALSAAALAQNIYVGGAVGQAHYDFDCAGSPSCDKNDTGGKVFGGYKFTPNIAVEASYTNFGKAKSGVPIPGFGVVTGDLKGEGFGAGVAFFAPFANDFSGVARLGVASNKFKLSAQSETSTEGTYGLGLSYNVTKQVSLDLAWDGTRGKFQGETVKLNMFTLGATYSF
jgi:OOP family OmpA-OmpF porin